MVRSNTTVIFRMKIFTHTLVFVKNKILRDEILYNNQLNGKSNSNSNNIATVSLLSVFFA